MITRDMVNEFLSRTSGVSKPEELSPKQRFDIFMNGIIKAGPAPKMSERPGVLATGRLRAEADMAGLVGKFTAAGGHEVVVAKVDRISHWWMLETDGDPVLYLGTPSSLKKYQQSK